MILADRDCDSALTGAAEIRDARGVFVGEDLVGEMDLARSKLLVVSVVSKYTEAR